VRPCAFASTGLLLRLRSHVPAAVRIEQPTKFFPWHVPMGARGVPHVNLLGVEWQPASSIERFFEELASREHFRGITREKVVAGIGTFRPLDGNTLHQDRF